MIRCEIAKRREAFELNAAFEVPGDSRVLGVVGPSGCGKTTLLDCIAGIERPDSGRIRVSGADWFDSQNGVDHSLRDRRVGYVFQDGLLFDHLSVRSNLAYGAPQGGSRELELVADDLGITHLLDRMPNEASGGERRRIAMGRALLSNPQLLLFDEPLTGLDGITAGRVLVYLRRLLARTRVPAIYVSHAPGDVLYICDWAIGMAGGRVVHGGDPASVLSVDACAGSRELAELRSIFDARLVESDGSARTTTYECATGVRVVALGMAAEDSSDECALAVFARDVVLGATRPEGISARNVYMGRVKRIERTAAMAVVEVDIGVCILSEVGYESLREMSLTEGSEVCAFFKGVGRFNDWFDAA